MIDPRRKYLLTEFASNVLEMAMDEGIPMAEAVIGLRAAAHLMEMKLRQPKLSQDQMSQLYSLLVDGEATLSAHNGASGGRPC
jgi:hypothetical protein